ASLRLSEVLEIEPMMMPMRWVTSWFLSGLDANRNRAPRGSIPRRACRGARASGEHRLEARVIRLHAFGHAGGEDEVAHLLARVGDPEREEGAVRDGRERQGVDGVGSFDADHRFGRHLSVGWC